MRDFEKEVIDFVRKYSSQCDVLLETKILHDLGIDGDDADPFLEDYSKEFSIDLSMFEYDDYFFGEFEHLLTSAIFGPLENLGKKVLTVKDLVNAAKTGSLSPSGKWEQVYWSKLSQFCRQLHRR